MTVKPYKKYYLEDVKDNVGGMLELAVRCGLNPITTWQAFVVSDVAREIEKANPRYLAGYSSRDYLDIVERAMGESTSKTMPSVGQTSQAYDEYYWAGSSITELQYETGLTYYNIERYCPLSDVLALYGTLHEADSTKFIDIAKAKIKGKKSDTNLKALRKAVGMTQRELAERSNVEQRSIEMYEQRRNDINKAQTETVYRLAKALGCDIEDLIEL